MLELGDLLALVPIAHDTGVPHQEFPTPSPDTSGGEGGPSSLVILAGVVVTLLAAGAHLWLRERNRRHEE
jgi:hypothetical protein